MRMFTSPRPGRCASCEGRITGRPVYSRDEAYCCVGCVAGGPCVCDYEADLADDGVDGLGLPFALDASLVGQEADERRATTPEPLPAHAEHRVATPARLAAETAR